MCTPTVRKISGPYRFFFCSFDCNEPKHVHVERDGMVCKFWLNPVALSRNIGFSAGEINVIPRRVRAEITKIPEAWNEHCG